MKPETANWIKTNYSRNALPSGRQAKLYLIGEAIGTQIRGVSLDCISDSELCNYSRIAINTAYKRGKSIPTDHTTTKKGSCEPNNPLSKVTDDELHRWANLPFDEENPNIELDRELAIKELERRRLRRDSRCTRSLEACL